MELIEAIRILGALADGKNPLTDAALEASSVCALPQIQTALKRAIVAMESQQKYDEKKKNRPTKDGKYWSHAEDEQVCEEVRQNMDFQEIAKKHDRSVPSIVARLVKLGKIGSRPGAKVPPKVA